MLPILACDLCTCTTLFLCCCGVLEGYHRSIQKRDTAVGLGEDWGTTTDLAMTASQVRSVCSQTPPRYFPSAYPQFVFGHIDYFVFVVPYIISPHFRRARRGNGWIADPGRHRERGDQRGGGGGHQILGGYQARYWWAVPGVRGRFEALPAGCREVCHRLPATTTTTTRSPPPPLLQLLFVGVVV